MGSSSPQPPILESSWHLDRTPETGSPDTETEDQATVGSGSELASPMHAVTASVLMKRTP